MATIARSRRINLSPPQVVVLSFALTIAIGTILLSLPAASADGQGIGLLNAYFTASSATCVTGLVVITTGTALSRFGQIVVLLLIQIGGLGLMTMTTFLYLLIGRRIGLRGRMLIQESLGQETIAGIIRLVRSIFVFTFGAELLGTLILTMRFSADMPLNQAAYFGLFHAISAFCNAGFDLFGNSIVRYASDPVVVLTIGSLLVVGGMGFLVLRNLWFHRTAKQRLTLHTRVVLRATAWLIGIGFVTVLALEYSNPATLGALPLHGKLLSALFTAITPRTAGFNTVPTGLLGGSTLMLLIVLMFIGASPGGTGGGIKTTTAWVIYRTVISTLRGKEDVEAAGRTLPRMAHRRAMAIAVISLSLVILVTAVLLSSEKTTLMDALFETMSAFGTVGLSTGLTPSLSALGRVLIALTMLAGRVGPFTLAIAFNSQKGNSSMHYPEERVIVG